MVKIAYAIGACTVSLIASIQIDSSLCHSPSMSFEDFVTTYGRTYSRGSPEWQMRQAIFEKSVQEVQELNCGIEKNDWRARVNMFADWTTTEFKGLMGYKRGARPNSPGPALDLESSRVGVRRARRTVEPAPLPKAITWGNLTSIRESQDQGSCGSCWAVAAATAMKAHSEIHLHKKQAVDADALTYCTPNPEHCGGDGGCEGATAALAFEYALRFGDADNLRKGTCPDKALIESVPATRGVLKVNGREVHAAQEGVELASGGHFDHRGPGVGMRGWVKLPENKQEPLMRALVELGPVAISVAPGNGWTWYQEGVLAAKGCDKENVVAHAVILYGYGEGPGLHTPWVSFWRIKNSWGRDWGEQGTIRLQRFEDEENHCGWDYEPEKGSACLGGPKKVWVCGSCGILYDSALPVYKDVATL